MPDPDGVIDVGDAVICARTEAGDEIDSDRAPTPTGQLLRAAARRLLLEGGERVTYTHVDHGQNPILRTDADGEIIDRAAFGPYGIARTSRPSGYGYSDKSEDASTGLVYFGARYYDPMLGRWTQPDPEFAAPDNATALGRPQEAAANYVYALNNPVFFHDDDGRLGDGDPSASVPLPWPVNGGSAVFSNNMNDALTNQVARHPNSQNLLRQARQTVDAVRQEITAHENYAAAMRKMATQSENFARDFLNGNSPGEIEGRDRILANARTMRQYALRADRQIAVYRTQESNLTRNIQRVSARSAAHSIVKDRLRQRRVGGELPFIHRPAEPQRPPGRPTPRPGQPPGATAAKPRPARPRRHRAVGGPGVKHSICRRICPSVATANRSLGSSTPPRGPLSWVRRPCG